MAETKRPTPVPFHPPVGVSDETYRRNGRWMTVLVTAIVVLAADVYVVVQRP